jgi:hypothetical protein
LASTPETWDIKKMQAGTTTTRKEESLLLCVLPSTRTLFHHSMFCILLFLPVCVENQMNRS